MRQFSRVLVVLSLIGLAFPLSMAGLSPGNVVDRFFESYRAGDVDGMLGLYATDATFEDVSQRHSFKGTEQLRAMLTGIAQLHKTMNLEETRRTIDGDTVVVEFVYSGKLNGAVLSQISGKEDCPSLDYRLPATGWYTVRNGKIVAQKDYIDFATYKELPQQILAGGAGE